MVSVALVAACESDTDSGPATPARSLIRFDPIGRESAPRRPLAPEKLPAGWSIAGGHLSEGTAPRISATNSLFMPVTSTADAGPALVAGYVNDDEAPPYFCAMRRANPHGPLAFPGTLGHPDILRWGQDLTALPVAHTTSSTVGSANEVFVLGREVSDAELRKAATSVQWSDRGDNPPTLTLPPGFRLRATTNLAAQEHPFGASLALERGASSVGISQEDANASARFFVRFWSAVTKGQKCREFRSQHTRIRGQTIVRLFDDDSAASRAAVSKLSRSLRRGSANAYCAVLPDARAELAERCTTW